MSDALTTLKHYFVDEAGNPVLFDGSGKVLVGSEGCSRYFAVGLLDVPGAAALDFINNSDTRLRDAAARQIKHRSVVKDFFTTAAAGKTLKTVRKTKNRKR